MLPNSVQIQSAMLTLPFNWRVLNASSVTVHLLEQAHAAGMYYVTASCLARACLEQLIESRGWDRRSEPIAVVPHRYGLRINDGLFHVLPQIDDNVLKTVAKLARMRLVTTVLAPPWSYLAARRLLDDGKHLDVLAIDQYVSLRICFTTMDIKLSRADALFRLLSWYNKIARSSGTPAAMLIRIPQKRGGTE